MVARRSCIRLLTFVCHSVGLLAMTSLRLHAEDPAMNADDFEKLVRPILVAQCLECHTDGTEEGGLRLTSREAILAGGDSGPAFNETDPQQSLLLKAIRRTDDLAMPPDHPLRDSELRVLEAWILSGVPWGKAPNDSAVRHEFEITQADREHWSFRALERSSLPDVNRSGWSSSRIDQWVLHRQESAGIEPAPQADRRTMIRRLSFDLTGLPPDSDELARMLEDRSPDEIVLARYVDRLLASPHYGVRWGRHWLDVARFADTKDGVLMFGDDRMRPYAYTYRDYVIRAFNEDIPYDEFIVDQLAADQAGRDHEPWRLAGMGLLTLGRMYDNNIHDVIDDQIDVVTRGFLGLTVTCARCHDHKYDPVSMDDYYALYGIFASCEAPLELPRIDDEPIAESAKSVEDALAAKRTEIETFLEEQFQLLSNTARERTTDYLVRVATKPADPLETAIFFLSLAPTDLRPQIVSRWRYTIAQRANDSDPVFGMWYRLSQLSAKELDAETFRAQAQELVNQSLESSATGEAPKDHPLVLAALGLQMPSDMEQVAQRYGALLQWVWRKERGELTDEQASSDPLALAVRDASSDQIAGLRDLVIGPSSPADFPRSQTRKYMSREQTDRFGGLNIELDRIAAQSKEAVARAMVVRDKDQLYSPRIFVRGNPSVPGEAVSRRFLELLNDSVGAPHAFEQGSGRLELARAIASPANPLTSRVMVNRVWMHHFGEPLVASPSDFGRRTTGGSHSELLDELALDLTQDWSLKRLHRKMVLSATYAQDSEPASSTIALARQIDPDGLLFWRHPMRRLEFEAMRDAMFAVSDSLLTKMGGRSVDLTSPGAPGVRTVYGLVDRQNLPGMYRVFDFASPDVSVGRRPRTLVAQQTLFALNSPLMLERSAALVDFVSHHGGDDDAKLRLMVERVWQRPLTDDELARFKGFLQPNANEPITREAWEQLAQILLSSNEFLYLD